MAAATLLQRLLEQSSFPYNKVRIQTSVKDGVLQLSGSVPIEYGSLFNLAVHDLVLKHGKDLLIKSVSRANLSFTKAASRERKQYELSLADSELEEIIDPPEVLSRLVDFAAHHIKAARSQNEEVVVYTGAGISTAASIPDFRGPSGVWTCQDRGLPAPDCVDLEVAVPTYAHRCLVRLQDDDVISYVVSQNVDGLHRRSGIRAELLSELHGNCYIEKCAACGAEYLRTFDVTYRRGPYFRRVVDELSQSGISHITGRKCCSCEAGMLRDSVIHFREDLPEDHLDRALAHGKAAHVALCIGSSLRVTPAADIPATCKGVMIVINLQRTGRDADALSTGGVVIHGRADETMALLMQRLGVHFPHTPALSRQYADQFLAQARLMQAAEDDEFRRAALVVADARNGPSRNTRSAKALRTTCSSTATTSPPAPAAAEHIQQRTSPATPATPTSPAHDPTSQMSQFFADLGFPATMHQLPPHLLVSHTATPTHPPSARKRQKPPPPPEHTFTLTVSVPPSYPLPLTDFVERVEFDLPSTATSATHATTCAPLVLDSAPFVTRPFTFASSAPVHVSTRIFFRPNLGDASKDALRVVHTLDPRQSQGSTEVAVPRLRPTGLLRGVGPDSRASLRPVDTRVRRLDGSSYIEPKAAELDQ